MATAAEAKQVSVSDLVRETFRELILRAVVYCREYAMQQGPATAPSAFLYCLSYCLMPLYERLKNDTMLQEMLQELFGVSISDLAKTMEEIQKSLTITLPAQVQEIRKRIQQLAPAVTQLTPQELAMLLGPGLRTALATTE